MPNKGNPKQTTAAADPIALTCPNCKGPIVKGQQVPATFRFVRYDSPRPHPVLSRPITLEGIVRLDGGETPRSFSLGEHLRQRAAIGGERERAELEHFENLWTDLVANALVADIRRELEQEMAPHEPEVPNMAVSAAARPTSSHAPSAKTSG